jgi:hypothetical protein
MKWHKLIWLKPRAASYDKEIIIKDDIHHGRPYKTILKMNGVRLSNLHLTDEFP